MLENDTQPHSMMSIKQRNQIREYSLCHYQPFCTYNTTKEHVRKDSDVVVR